MGWGHKNDTEPYGRGGGYQVYLIVIEPKSSNPPPLAKNNDLSLNVSHPDSRPFTTLNNWENINNDNI